MRACSQCATPMTADSGRFCPSCGGPLVESASAGSTTASLVGATFDGFAIEAVIGGGAFGTVYRGRQVALDRPVALKVPTHEIAADPIMARRFAREARSAARVQHPGVVQIFAVGELADGRPYLAMQLVEGEPLDRCLADGPLAAVRALRIVRAIASALGETHAADVVHRDLKPTNIIWRRDRNGDDRITIVDFGIALAKPGTAEATRLTQGGLIGTPHYMSPEQAHGEQVDARADLYALGCVLFELVTGRPPFEGSAVEVMLAHLGRPAPLPSSLEPAVPEVIDRLCAALMQKKPDDRPASADAVVAAIDGALGELAGAPLPARSAKLGATRRGTRSQPRVRASGVATRQELPPGTLVPRRKGPPRWLVASGAVAILLAGAGFGAFVIGHDRSASAGASHEEPTDQPDGPTHPGAGRREVFRDDGELVLRVLVPDPIRAGKPIRPHLEVKNKLGQPVIADSIVVTITDPHGAAKGLTAHPHGDESGHYDFHYAFPQPGTYLMRVFPPSIDTAFEVPIEVK
ncbi:MAG: protein kinase domain-containing protein [Acidobacteriota bacterium]